MSRKNAIASFSVGAAAVLLGSVPTLAADEAAAPAAPATATDGPPTDWGLTKQYYPVRGFPVVGGGALSHTCVGAGL